MGQSLQPVLMRRCALSPLPSGGLGAVECPVAWRPCFRCRPSLLSQGVIRVLTNSASGDCLRVGEWELPRRRPCDRHSRGQHDPGQDRGLRRPQARRMRLRDLIPGRHELRQGKTCNHRARSLQLGAMVACETFSNREPARTGHASARSAEFASESTWRPDDNCPRRVTAMTDSAISARTYDSSSCRFSPNLSSAKWR